MPHCLFDSARELVGDQVVSSLQLAVLWRSNFFFFFTSGSKRCFQIFLNFTSVSSFLFDLLFLQIFFFFTFFLRKFKILSYNSWVFESLGVYITLIMVQDFINWRILSNIVKERILGFNLLCIKITFDFNFS